MKEQESIPARRPRVTPETFDRLESLVVRTIVEWHDPKACTKPACDCSEDPTPLDFTEEQLLEMLAARLAQWRRSGA